MDTVVESPIVQQPPVGDQQRSVSPTGSRKRAFDEVNGVMEGDGGIEPQTTTQIPTPNGGEEQPPLNVLATNGPVPPTAVLPPATMGTENGPIEPAAISTNTMSNPAVTSAQIPVPRPKTPVSFPASTTTAPPPVTTEAGNGPIEPAPISTNAISNPVVASAPSPVPAPKTPGSFPAMSNKKVKLSPASIEAKRIEKEIRDRQRAEERAKKEEEKRVKEEEKKKREEEREEERKKKEEKRKVKEEERVAREEEKRKKEEEKLKKERSQMRLNAFFAKPAASNTTAMSARNGNSESKSDAAANDETGERKPSEPSAAPKSISDYERNFPDFFLQSHTSVAPINRFGRDEEALRHVRETVDGIFTRSNPDTGSIQPDMPFRPAELFHIMPYKRRRGKQKLPTIKEILIQMQGSPSDPINLTEEKGTTEVNGNPENILKKIPVKSLKFGEDVRPPYQGTFTRPVPERSALRLSRNPFKREIPGMNYDYDSEAEWEEPEEGEDLDSEGEEEMSDDGDEDMNDFLDDADEDQPNPKRKMIVGDLEPACSGLCWEDENGVNTELSEYRMEIISDLPRFKFPIDPHSNSYWQTSPAARANTKPSNSASTHPSNNKHSSDMHPPPVPNNGTGEANTFNLLNWSSTQPNGHSSKAQLSQGNADGTQTHASNLKVRGDANSIKPKRPFPPDQLAELKGIVDGSDLTKTGLIEVVKKRFPKIPKGVLRDTVSDVATRVGDKEADKKWVLKS